MQLITKKEINKKVFYGTTSKAKLKEVQEFFNYLNISIYSPVDLQIMIDIPETGSTMEENALIKLKAYRQQSQLNQYVILTDDSGIEIDALNGAPGVHTRDWKGYTMTDEEIIQYCLKEMRGIPKPKRTARMKTVIAMSAHSRDPVLVIGNLEGIITENIGSNRINGFPFSYLFYSDKYQSLLGDLQLLRQEEKQKIGFISHRQIAIEKILETIISLK